MTMAFIWRHSTPLLHPFRAYYYSSQVYWMDWCKRGIQKHSKFPKIPRKHTHDRAEVPQLMGLAKFDSAKLVNSLTVIKSSAIILLKFYNAMTLKYRRRRQNAPPTATQQQGFVWRKFLAPCVPENHVEIYVTFRTSHLKPNFETLKTFQIDLPPTTRRNVKRPTTDHHCAVTAPS